MHRSKAADSLRAALTSQFGETARDTIDSEVEAGLAGRRDLAREDLDAIEKNVLAALRQAKKARPAGAPWSRTPGPPGGDDQQRRIPAMAQTAGPSIWAGDTKLVQRRRSVAVPQTPPLLSPTKKAMSSSASAPSGLGASLRRTAQLPPRRKPKDLYDLMIEFEDEDHVRYEELRKQKVEALRADYKKGLDKQMEYKAMSRQRAEEELRTTRAQTLAKVEDYRQQESEKALRKAQSFQDVKQQMAEELEAVTQRRGRDKAQQQRDREDLDGAMALQQSLCDQQAQAKRGVQAQRGQDMRARRAQAAEARRHRKASDKEEDARGAAEFARRADERKAEGNKQYLVRQKVVDARGPMGVSALVPTLQRERAEDARVDRSIIAVARKVEDEHYQKAETMETQARTIKAFHFNQAAEQRQRRGQPEREASLEQAAIWRREDEEHWARERQAKEREKQMRGTMDSDLCQRLHQDKEVHRMDLGGSSAIGGSEYAYHKTITARMASTGFRPDVSATLLTKVSAERVGKVGQ